MYNKIQTPEKPMRSKNSGIIFGILLLAAGFLLLFDRTGLLPGRVADVLLTWPMILIVIGLINLSKSRTSTSGLILLLVGGFFLLPKIFDLPSGFHHNFWPLILIVAGAVLLLSHDKRRSFFSVKTDRQVTSDSYFNITAILGGGERVITAQNLEGGKVECFMGGAEASLVNSTLSQGKNIIDISIMFGGISFIIPPDWTVHSEVNAILGGYSDSRTLVGQPSTQPEKTIYIRGNVMFGGCEVKSY